MFVCSPKISLSIGPEDNEPHQFCRIDESEDKENDSSYQPDHDEDFDDEYVPDSLSEHTSTSEAVKEMETNRFSVSFNQPNTSRCDDTEMYVDESRGKKGDKKANFCFYCKTKH